MAGGKNNLFFERQEGTAKFYPPLFSPTRLFRLLAAGQEKGNPPEPGNHPPQITAQRHTSFAAPARGP